MNILYLFGNGLDLSLGMNTSYLDFYDHYCTKDKTEQDERICKLKESIQAGKEDWKDLEWQLGQYTTEIPDKGSFQNLYFDLSDHLVQYLRLEQDKVIAEELDRDRFVDHLSHPENFLTPTDHRNITSRYPSPNLRNINIITFNYTDTIEKILKKGKKGVPEEGHDSQGRTWRIAQLHHVHGKLGENILLGVNDADQIANKDFALDQDVRDLIIKPESNAAIKSDVDQHCRGLISQAELIVLFGLSLGETDTYWWKAIGSRLMQSNATLLIFHHEKELLKENRGQLRGLLERTVRSRFIHLAELKVKEADMRSQIFIGSTTSIFKGIRTLPKVTTESA